MKLVWIISLFLAAAAIISTVVVLLLQKRSKKSTISNWKPFPVTGESFPRYFTYYTAGLDTAVDSNSSDQYELYRTTVDLQLHKSNLQTTESEFSLKNSRSFVFDNSVYHLIKNNDNTNKTSLLKEEIEMFYEGFGVEKDDKMSFSKALPSSFGGCAFDLNKGNDKFYCITGGFEDGTNTPINKVFFGELNGNKEISNVTLSLPRAEHETVVVHARNNKGTKVNWLILTIGGLTQTDTQQNFTCVPTVEVGVIQDQSIPQSFQQVNNKRWNMQYPRRQFAAQVVEFRKGDELEVYVYVAGGLDEQGKEVKQVERLGPFTKKLALAATTSEEADFNWANGDKSLSWSTVGSLKQTSGKNTDMFLYYSGGPPSDENGGSDSDSGGVVYLYVVGGAGGFVEKVVLQRDIDPSQDFETETGWKVYLDQNQKSNSFGWGEGDVEGFYTLEEVNQNVDEENMVFPTNTITAVQDFDWPFNGPFTSFRNHAYATFYTENGRDLLRNSDAGVVKNIYKYSTDENFSYYFPYIFRFSPMYNYSTVIYCSEATIAAVNTSSPVSDGVLTASYRPCMIQHFEISSTSQGNSPNATLKRIDAMSKTPTINVQHNFGYNQTNLFEEGNYNPPTLEETEFKPVVVEIDANVKEVMYPKSRTLTKDQDSTKNFPYITRENLKKEYITGNRSGSCVARTSRYLYIMLGRHMDGNLLRHHATTVHHKERDIERDYRCLNTLQSHEGKFEELDRFHTLQTTLRYDYTTDAWDMPFYYREDEDFKNLCSSKQLVLKDGAATAVGKNQNGHECIYILGGDLKSNKFTFKTQDYAKGAPNLPYLIYDTTDEKNLIRFSSTGNNTRIPNMKNMYTASGVHVMVLNNLCGSDVRCDDNEPQNGINLILLTYNLVTDKWTKSTVRNMYNRMYHSMTYMKGVDGKPYLAVYGGIGSIDVTPMKGGTQETTTKYFSHSSHIWVPEEKNYAKVRLPKDNKCFFLIDVSSEELDSQTTSTVNKLFKDFRTFDGTHDELYKENILDNNEGSNNPVNLFQGKFAHTEIVYHPQKKKLYLFPGLDYTSQYPDILNCLQKKTDIFAATDTSANEYVYKGVGPYFDDNSVFIGSIDVANNYKLEHVSIATGSVPSLRGLGYGVKAVVLPDNPDHILLVDGPRYGSHKFTYELGMFSPMAPDGIPQKDFIGQWAVYDTTTSYHYSNFFDIGQAKNFPFNFWPTGFAHYDTRNDTYFRVSGETAPYYTSWNHAAITAWLQKSFVYPSHDQKKRTMFFLNLEKMKLENVSSEDALNSGNSVTNLT